MNQSSKDTLGDKIKAYENIGSMLKLDSQLPAIVRLDGRSFSSFTKGMNRPFDVGMQTLMQETTKNLVEKTNALIGHTQSDEITLLLYNSPKELSQPFFGGRIQKICSSLAAIASVHFNSMLPGFFPEKVKLLPTFDCRVFNVPDKHTAYLSVLWREQDCTKNSVQMLARSLFSHKSLHGLNCDQMKEKIAKESEHEWDFYPVSFKRGSYFQKIKLTIPFTESEIVSLPEKHQARLNPNLIIERSKISRVTLPPLGNIKNIIEVLFDGATPIQYA